MTSTIGGGTIGGGGGGPPGTPGVVLPITFANRSTSLVTSSPPGSPETYLVLDDGSGGGSQPTPGGDPIPLTPGEHRLAASFFSTVNQSNARLWSVAQIRINGGAWTDLHPDIIFPIGVAGGAVLEPGGFFHFEVLASAEYEFRFLFALDGGPGGSEVTVVRGASELFRLSL